MEKLDFVLFEKALDDAKNFSDETDLEKFCIKGLTLRTLECFRRLMTAGSTDELKDFTDDDICKIVKYSKDLTPLYEQDRFLTGSTFSLLDRQKGAKRRRVL